MRSQFRAAVALASLVAFPALAPAQSAPASPADIPWQTCPCTGDLGNATVQVPAGLLFTGAAGAKQFMEMNENPTSGHERGIAIYPEGDHPWYVIFQFDETGYIKDDEKDSLDADAMIASIREGTEAANEEREKRGWPTMNVDGWHRPPYYDQQSNNLTWAILGSSDDGQVVNHSVRLLGRRGVMNVDLVLDPSQIDAAMPTFAEVITGFDFKAGNRYREFTSGDRVAAYGLTALVAGGAGAALVKSGLLQKLGKFIVVIFAALAAAAKKLYDKLAGKPAAESHA
jgi:uncharacterized membrane-anchored protein